MPKAPLIQLGAGLVRLLPPQHLGRKLLASCSFDLLRPYRKEATLAVVKKPGLSSQFGP